MHLVDFYYKKILQLHRGGSLISHIVRL